MASIDPRASELPSAHEPASLLDVAIGFVQNLRLLVLFPIVVGLAALAVTYALPRTYTATARLLPPQVQQSAATALANQLGALAGLAAGGAGIKSPVDTYVAILKSRTLADRLLARFKLREVYGVELDHDARAELVRRTRISAGRDGLIVIDVDDHDAKRAAELANGYVNELREFTQTLAVTEAGQRRLFFEKQLQRTRDDLAKSEVALRESGINEAALKAVPQSALEALARLKAQITAQEVKLGAMRAFMTEANPEYRQVQHELAALRAELAKAELVDTGKAKGAGAEYIAKFRDFKYHETLFELIAKQYEIARLDEAREGAVIQVVDAAIAPERSSKPRRTFTSVMAALGAFVVALMVVLFRRSLRTASRDPETAQKLERLRLSYRLGKKKQ